MCYKPGNPGVSVRGIGRTAGWDLKYLTFRRPFNRTPVQCHPLVDKMTILWFYGTVVPNIALEMKQLI